MIQNVECHTILNDEQGLGELTVPLSLLRRSVLATISLSKVYGPGSAYAFVKGWRILMPNHGLPAGYEIQEFNGGNEVNWVRVNHGANITFKLFADPDINAMALVTIYTL